MARHRCAHHRAESTQDGTSCGQNRELPVRPVSRRGLSGESRALRSADKTLPQAHRPRFSPDPFSSGRRERVQLEIFPHLVQVALLARSRIIKYKKGAKLQRAKGLKELQRTIAEYLPRLIPPLKDSANLRALLRADPRMLKGKQLKALEDQVDALLCAYMTLYFWFWGEEKCQVFGDLASGYIIGPKQMESESCS